MEELKVYSLKLVGGEEVIAKINFKDTEEWELHDARSVVMTGAGKLSLAPVIFSAAQDSVLTINPKSIAAFTTSIRPEFLEGYTNSVSPLTLPSKSIIMG